MSPNDEKRRKPVIGVTGGIGAGKSIVAGLFRSLGAAVVDSDGMAHRQLEDPSVVGVLRGWWGDRICRADGGVDRSVVASIVFEDPAELRRLEGFLYPRIEAERQRVMAILDQDEAVLAMVLDTPKLFEARLDQVCDAVVFVDADVEVRAARLAESRGWPRSELTRRERMMEVLDKKRSRADYVVINQSDAQNLRDQVERVFVAVLRAFGE